MAETTALCRLTKIRRSNNPLRNAAKPGFIPTRKQACNGLLKGQKCSLPNLPDIFCALQQNFFLCLQ